MIKILIIIACAILWYLGGQIKNRYRDTFIPLILGAYYGWTLVWWVGILVFLGFSAMRMGYGSWDPEHDLTPSFLARITHDRQGYIIRIIYGVLVTLNGALPLMFYTKAYLPGILYIIVVSAIMGWMCKEEFRVGVIDPITGMLVGGVVLWL